MKRKNTSVSHKCKARLCDTLSNETHLCKAHSCEVQLCEAHQRVSNAFSNASFSNKDLNQLEKSIGYNFKNTELLKHALRHSSIKRHAIPFERLEFLGDRILGVVIAEYIYKTTKGAEGGMAKMHSAFVCATSCYQIALSLGVNNIIKTAGKALHDNPTVLADAIEAILGAIFIDSKSNYKLLQKLIMTLWQPVIDHYNAADQEPKTQLQEIVQSVSNSVPLYEVLDESGPKHRPVFTVQLSTLGHTLTAHGNSKKEAETEAARSMLHLIKSSKA